jgi:nucleotide-binding universal stress UspA family protein
MTSAMQRWEGKLGAASEGKGETIDHVMVPLDGSTASKAALPVARTMARLFGATLHILYARDEPLEPQQTIQELGLTPEELHGVVLDRLSGTPAEAIIPAAQDFKSSLLVMCTHTAAETDQLSFGTVAEAVLSKGPDRVLLIAPERGLKEWTIRRVLLAHDGTPSADTAIAPAADIASRAKAEVTAIHVAARKAPRPSEEGSLPAPRYVDQPQHEWPAWAGEFLDRMLALGSPPAAMDFKLLVTGGQPGSEVAQIARDSNADLVVVAWHGHWEELRAETLKVIARRSGCPVLLVSTRECIQ